MHAELMRSPGVRLELQKRDVQPSRVTSQVKPLCNPPFCQGSSGAVHTVPGRHSFSIQPVPPDRPVDPTLSPIDFAPGKSNIHFFNCSILKLKREMLICRRVFGDNHHTGSVLVQSMDDSRPAYPADPLEMRPAVQEGIDQSAAPMPGSGMNRQSRCFIDHDTVCVLMENVQRQGLGMDGRITGRR